MISLRSDKEFIINIKLNIVGSSFEPETRLILYNENPEFFFGFKGDSVEVKIPPLLDVVPNNTIFQGAIEVLVEDFHTVIWKDMITLISVEQKNGVKVESILEDTNLNNNIKVVSKLIDVSQQKKNISVSVQLH